MAGLPFRQWLGVGVAVVIIGIVATARTVAVTGVSDVDPVSLGGWKIASTWSSR